MLVPHGVFPPDAAVPFPDAVPRGGMISAALCQLGRGTSTAHKASPAPRRNVDPGRKSVPRESSCGAGCWAYPGAVASRAVLSRGYTPARRPTLPSAFPVRSSLAGTLCVPLQVRHLVTGMLLVCSHRNCHLLETQPLKVRVHHPELAFCCILLYPSRSSSSSAKAFSTFE